MRINIPRILSNKLKKSNKLDNKILSNKKISELLSIDYDKDMKKFVDVLIKSWIATTDDLMKYWIFDTLKVLVKAWITSPDDLIKLKEIILSWTHYKLEPIIKAWINKADDLAKCENIIEDREEIDLNKLIEVWALSQENAEKYSKLASKWFYVKDYKDDYNKILSDNINSLHPDMWLDIELTEKEAEKIINFVNSIWWINKWYTILILTVEKMIKDGINKESFPSILLKKLDNYKKILDMYPEDKIPEWLKISTWLEIEITDYFEDWYQTTTWQDYQTAAYEIIDNAKVATWEDWVIEFSTKPSTNPLVTLLEIHLLQELNLLDLNDMQKLSWFTENVKYCSRKWTWYHLNIWSDTDIAWDENILFIQNLSTILPRSWISNWDEVDEINRRANMRHQYSDYSVYPYNDSTDYIELRTYSIDDVELFEKNVLFNTYAVMWSQAQNKVSKVNSNIVLKLKDYDGINNANDLLHYLENNDYFLEYKDFKSKKIAVEFMFMQISILRAIDDYNNNFIDDELFSDEIFSELSGPWKDYFYDLLLSDQKETIWFEDKWLSSIVVKRHATNLYKSFDATKYANKEEPFTFNEAKELLNKYWDTVDEKWIPYIIKWLNKKVLWEILCRNCSDYGEEGWSERLENKIKDQISNIDRIKSYIKREDKDIVVDRQYLLKYFEKNMSLWRLNPYEEINIDFVNRIIHLNNFFLKEDNTNANSVLDTTVVDGQKYVEHDIPKSSIFDTWYMRKWYNYYQWWSENMLLHSAQKIALNYMWNVKDILNTDYDERPAIKMAA